MPTKRATVASAERAEALRILAASAPLRPSYGGVNDARPVGGGLGDVYRPVSDGLPSLSAPNSPWQVMVPDAMDADTNAALGKLKAALGGDVSLYVQQRLGYRTHEELALALSDAQADAVALAIYNIEARQQGIIVADQTGIGKGRVAAAMVKYGIEQGVRPIFLTEKPNLFTDIYRDLLAIGGDQYRPYIVNARSDKSNIKDADGTVVYRAEPADVQRKVVKGVIERVESRGFKAAMPGYDYVVATYSQFNKGFDWDGKRETAKGLKARSYDKLPEKCKFLYALAANNLIILDESHNASGASNTGDFVGRVIARTKGTTFLSATFAKRADNMVVYAAKTVMSEAGLGNDELVTAVQRGGVALQEIISGQLVGAGQLLRRERPYAGVEVNWLTLTAQAADHRARADEMMAILRLIIQFQEDYINPLIARLNEAMQGQQAEKTAGTDKGGIDNTPMFSRVFNMVFQMLFGIKAHSVAAHAIARLREGKKVIITFQSTMGAFLERLDAEEDEDEEGLSGLGATDADDLTMPTDRPVRATFDVVLERILELALAYSVKDSKGDRTKKTVPLDLLPDSGRMEYSFILSRIKQVSQTVSISPIDVLTKLIKEAGFGVAEVTGRGRYVDLADDNRTGVIRSRVRENTADAFRRFNNNEVDVLLLNAAGSTGASAHAVATAKVPASKVKQRVMIIHQASLDINTEVQKRGRIFRTGQILAPIYDYLTSAIPAEQRLMMMLQRKLKSLDANTSSNQKQSGKLLDAGADGFADFLNHHGDRIVAEVLMENKKLDKMLGGVVQAAIAAGSITLVGESDDIKSVPLDFAMRVTGRVAVLDTKDQEAFYTEVSDRYRELIAYLDSVGQNDLEVSTLDLRATTLKSDVILPGEGGRSAFGDSVYLEKANCRNLTKPLGFPAVQLEIRRALDAAADYLAPDPENRALTPLFVRERTVETATVFLNQRLQVMEDEAEQELPDDVAKELVKRKLNPDRLQRESPDEYERIVEAIKGEKRLEEQQRRILIRLEATNVIASLRYFEIGRGYMVPNPDLDVHASRADFIPAVFLGVRPNLKKRNPWAPAVVQLRFTLASGHRTLTFNYKNPLARRAYTSGQPAPWNGELNEGTWETLCREASADFETRYLLTGNVLKALGVSDFADYKLKLVAFTSASGEERKGILLPKLYNKAIESGQGAQALDVNTVMLPLFKPEVVDEIVRVYPTMKTSGVVLKAVLNNDVRAEVTPNLGAWFDLDAYWKAEGAGLGRKLVTNTALLTALGSNKEFSKQRGADWEFRPQFAARYLSESTLRAVLLALGGLGFRLALRRETADRFGLTPPAGEITAGKPWPAPPNAPKPRAVKPVWTPPASADNGLADLKKQLHTAAMTCAAARKKAPRAVLAGTPKRGGKGRIGHGRIKSTI